MSNHEVTRRLEWDMAHRIDGHGGKCQHLHGHRYAAEITCRAAALDELGMVVDFGIIKELVGKFIDDNWDHNTMYGVGDTWMERLASEARMLWDDAKPFRYWYVLPDPPTAENIAQALCLVAQDKLSEHRLEVVRIDLWETPNCRARFEPTPSIESALVDAIKSSSHLLDAIK